MSARKKGVGDIYFPLGIAFWTSRCFASGFRVVTFWVDFPARWVFVRQGKWVVLVDFLCYAILLVYLRLVGIGFLWCFAVFFLVFFLRLSHGYHDRDLVMKFSRDIFIGDSGRRGLTPLAH